MKIFTLFAQMIITSTLIASPVDDLRHVKTYSQLARFIYKKSNKTTSVKYLLEGLHSNACIRLSEHSSDIPIREIFGTIIEDFYNESLGNDFFESGKCYGVRVICSFRDSDDELYRYHIGIFDDRQYAIMMNFLNTMRHKPK